VLNFCSTATRSPTSSSRRRRHRSSSAKYTNRPFKRQRRNTKRLVIGGVARATMRGIIDRAARHCAALLQCVCACVSAARDTRRCDGRLVNMVYVQSIRRSTTSIARTRPAGKSAHSGLITENKYRLSLVNPRDGIVQ